MRVLGIEATVKSCFVFMQTSFSIVGLSISTWYLIYSQRTSTNVVWLTVHKRTNLLQRLWFSSFAKSGLEKISAPCVLSEPYWLSILTYLLIPVSCRIMTTLSITLGSNVISLFYVITFAVSRKLKTPILKVVQEIILLSLAIVPHEKFSKIKALQCIIGEEGKYKIFEGLRTP